MTRWLASFAVLMSVTGVLLAQAYGPRSSGPGLMDPFHGPGHLPVPGGEAMKCAKCDRAMVLTVDDVRELSLAAYWDIKMYGNAFVEVDEEAKTIRLLDPLSVDVVDLRGRVELFGNWAKSRRG